MAAKIIADPLLIFLKKDANAVLDPFATPMSGLPSPSKSVMVTPLAPARNCCVPGNVSVLATTLKEILLPTSCICKYAKVTIRIVGYYNIQFPITIQIAGSNEILVRVSNRNINSGSKRNSVTGTGIS